MSKIEIFPFPDKPRLHGEDCSHERNDWELHHWFAEGMLPWKLAKFLERTIEAVKRDIDRYARDYEEKYAGPYQATRLRPCRAGERFTLRETEFIDKCVRIRRDKAIGKTQWAIKSMEDCAKVLMRTPTEISDLWYDAENKYGSEPKSRPGLLH